MGNPIPKSDSQPSPLPSQPTPSSPSSPQPQAIPLPPSSHTTVPPPTSQVPENTTSLPPAALELAAKLFDLARAGDTAALTPYLSAGIPPNLTNHAGDTLLMLAAYHGHVDTVNALLDKGADPNVLNDRGQSPLAGTVFKGFDDVTKCLFEKGGDPTAGQPSALDCAYMFRRREVIRLFGGVVPDEGESASATREWA